MGFTISTKTKEQSFNQKIVYVSSKPNYDFQVETDFEFILGVQYDEKSNKCRLVNKYGYPQFKFKGEILPEKMIIEKVCKIMIDGTDNFITIKVGNVSEQVHNEANSPAENTHQTNNIEKNKSKIETERVKIVKKFLQ